MTSGGGQECVTLRNQSAAWMREATWGAEAKIVANASVLYGWWPSAPPNVAVSAGLGQPKMAPFCKGVRANSLALPWTGYQSRSTKYVSETFSFSPNLEANFLNQTLATVNDNPFDLWLLCGANGSCTDLTPMVMIGGGRGEQGQVKYDFKGTLGSSLNRGRTSGSVDWIKQNMKPLREKIILPHQFVFGPPFMDS